MRIQFFQTALICAIASFARIQAATKIQLNLAAGLRIEGISGFPPAHTLTAITALTGPHTGPKGLAFDGLDDGKQEIRFRSYITRQGVQYRSECRIHSSGGPQPTSIRYNLALERPCALMFENIHLRCSGEYEDDPKTDPITLDLSLKEGVEIAFAGPPPGPRIAAFSDEVLKGPKDIKIDGIRGTIGKVHFKMWQEKLEGRKYSSLCWIRRETPQAAAYGPLEIGVNAVYGNYMEKDGFILECQDETLDLVAAPTITLTQIEPYILAFTKPPLFAGVDQPKGDVVFKGLVTMDRSPIEFKLQGKGQIWDCDLKLNNDVNVQPHSLTIALVSEILPRDPIETQMTNGNVRASCTRKS